MLERITSSIISPDPDKTLMWSRSRPVGGNFFFGPYFASGLGSLARVTSLFLRSGLKLYLSHCPNCAKCIRVGVVSYAAPVRNA